MSNSSPLQWHILGTGAIGGLWACELEAEGRSPCAIFKNETILNDYQQQAGLTLERQGKTQQFSVAATCPERLSVPLEYLLITTKANQTLPALASIESRLNRDSTLVLMQNGLGVAEALLERHPQVRLLQASTTEGAYRPSPFHIVHAGQGHTLLGACSRDIDDDELATLAQSLSTPHLQVQPQENMEAVLWRKLAINCVINPLTALYDCRNGELLDSEETLRWMDLICDEILSLSAALGRQDWIRDIKQLVRQVAIDTAENHSSMLQDIQHGRRTEIDAINGHVCQIAKQQGLPAVSNRKLVERIHARERELGCR